MDIAEGCGVRDLQNELVAIALNSGEEDHLRVNAALALARVGDREAKLALKPIVTGGTERGKKDELKGAALQALWPDHIGLNEVLDALTPPSTGFLGQYWLFLSTKLPEGLQDADIPAALDWVARQSSNKPRGQRPFEDAMDRIMSKGWERIEVPGVPEAFAAATLARLDERPEVIVARVGARRDRDVLAKDAGRRRIVVSAVAVQLSKRPIESPWWVGYQSPLAMAEDFPWMAQQMESSDSVDLQRAWAKLMRSEFLRDDPEHLEILYRATLASTTAKEEFSWVF